MARPAHWLSTLRRPGRPGTTQDSLPAAGQALPSRVGYLQGPYERFLRYNCFPLSQAFLAHSFVDQARPVDAPVNTLGIRRVMFAVDDIDALVARMRAHGAELIGEMQYADTYRLAYIRGPEGIIVALAEQLG